MRCPFEKIAEIRKDYGDIERLQRCETRSLAKIPLNPPFSKGEKE
jgi:hypothetical protein